MRLPAHHRNAVRLPSSHCHSIALPFHLIPLDPFDRIDVIPSCPIASISSLLHRPQPNQPSNPIIPISYPLDIHIPSLLTICVNLVTSNPIASFSPISHAL